MRYALRTVLPATLLLAACATSGDGADASLRTITITETLRIDGNEADLVPISPLNGAVILADGSIAVAQSQDQRILFFGRTGARIDSLGRSGSGPGEFQAINYLGILGDSLWAFDFQNARVTLIGPDRRLVRTVAIPRMAPYETDGSRVEYGFLTPRGMYADGSFSAVAQRTAAEAVPGEPAVVLVRVGPNGAVSRVLAVTGVFGEERVIVVAGSRISGGLLSGGTLQAGAPDGSRFVVVRAPVEGSETGSLLLTIISAQGDTVAHRRYAFEPEPIPKAWSDSVVARRADQMARQLSPEIAEAFRREVHVPPFFPPFTRVLVGDDGVVWLEERLAGDRRWYLVFGPDGERLGRVSLPANTTVSAVRREYMWALEQDPDGVQSLVRHELGRE